MTQARPVLLMTRPRAASDAFVTALHAAGETGFDAVISPLIDVQTTGPLPDLARYHGLIFTSANGVAAYRALGGAARGACYVVGGATAAAARDGGFAPQSADGDAAALVRLIQDSAPSGRLLHLRGRHARGDIAATLNATGIATDEAVIYDQPLKDLTTEARAALTGTIPVVVPLFSPRSAARLADQAPQAGAPLLIAAMSRAIWEESIDLRPVRHIVTDQPSGDAMQNATLHLIALARMLESGQGAQ